MKKPVVIGTGIAVIGLLGFFLFGPGILLLVLTGNYIDQVRGPGIEIVNDTDTEISVRTQRNGYSYYKDTYCHPERFECPASALAPGESAVQSHGTRNQGDAVRFLVPVSYDDYHVETGELNDRGRPIMRLIDDVPFNLGNIQESGFLCYGAQVEEASVRTGGLFWQKRLLSFNWSDVLKSPVECGSQY